MDFKPGSARYAFGRFVLDLGRGVLLEDAEERALRPKSFSLLRHMVENADRLINRDEIMQVVWPGTFVTEDSITQCIGEIRRALSDMGQATLRTVPRRGYLLAGPVRLCDDVGAAPSASVADPGEREAEMPSPPTGRPIVIVLPFENIGGDPEQGYFADGLTADLVTDLTRFQELQIASPPHQAENPRPSAPEAIPETLPAASRFGSPTRAPRSISGRNALTGRSKTCSPCRRI
jgi:DNA-binding winged helix-turn-helix (wHTH) protein